MRKLMMAAVAMSLVSTVAVAKDTKKTTTTTTESTKDSQPTTTTSTDKQEQRTGPVNKEPHSVEIKDQGKSGTTLPPLGK